MSALDPKALAEEAAAARKQKQKEQRAKEAAEERAKRQRMAGYVDGKFDKYVERLNAAIPRAAANGDLRVSLEIEHFATYKLGEERGQALRPIWDQVVQHFEEQGFKAQVRVEHSIEWFHGEPGPGPDTVSIEVSWG